jgi:hypothetical protein
VKRGARALTEDELIESLTGVVLVADLVKPAERKAVSSSLLEQAETSLEEALDLEPGCDVAVGRCDQH